MNTFARPQGLELDRLREAFAATEEGDRLLTRSNDGKGRRMPASRLYEAAAQGRDDADVAVALSDSPTARAFHRRAVAASALFHFPETRAASSGLTLARHGDGCRIRTERSRAEPDQYFVVVEVTPTERAPTSLVVCDSQDRVRRFPLPALRDGVAQMIAEADSDLLRLIGDPNTKVYLR